MFDLQEIWSFLEECKQVGEKVVIGVHSDQTLRECSPDEQTYLPERFRYDLVRSHKSVSKVIEDAPLYVDTDFLTDNNIDIVCMLSSDNLPDQYHEIAYNEGKLHFIAPENESNNK